MNCLVSKIFKPNIRIPPTPDETSRVCGAQSRWENCGRCYVAVVAPIRKRWQLEKLENFNDPGWAEVLHLQLNHSLTSQYMRFI